MRHMIVFATLAIVTLSGCVGGTGDLTAQDAAKVADAEADRRASEPMFLGSFAIEGPFDLERFEAMIEAEGTAEDAEAFDVFELRVQNGPAGDGRTGSWFDMYASFEESFVRILVIQVLEDGSTRVYSEDVVFEMEVEMEVDAGGPALLLSNLPGFEMTASSGRVTASCKVPSWNVDSPEAAAIAHGDAAFAQHVIDQPDAEYMYLYSPSLGCEPNLWTIAHLDLDLLLDDQVPDVAYVVIDADSGAILASDIDDGSMFVVTETVTVLEVDATLQGPLVPTLGVGAARESVYTFDVDDAFELTVYAEGSDGLFSLENPVGEVTDGASLDLTIDEPQSGTWTLTYAYHTDLPRETHEVYAYAEAIIPAS